MTFLNDEDTTSLYSDCVPEIFPELENNDPQILSQRLHPISKRVHSKPSKRRAKRNSKQETFIFREEIHLLIVKRASLSKRRQILSSKKGISLISILTPSIINLLS